MKEIKSVIFGDTLLLDEDEEEFNTILKLAEKYPVNVFGVINKKLNSIGYSLALGKLK